MKSLYESILDDEDILISDIKEFANDPLIVIYEILKNNEDKSRILELIDNGLLDTFLMDNFFIDRNKFGLGCKIIEYDNSIYLKFHYWGNSLALICFIYDKSKSSNMTIRYLSKDELSYNQDFIYTPIIDSKFYKQHKKVQSNLKKIGYKKTNIYDNDEFIYLTKNYEK